MNKICKHCAEWGKLSEVLYEDIDGKMKQMYCVTCHDIIQDVKRLACDLKASLEKEPSPMTIWERFQKMLKRLGQSHKKRP